MKSDNKINANSPYLPIWMKVLNKKILVVGGGRIAARRIASLLDHGALVTVVAPEISSEIRSLAATGSLVLIENVFETDHLAGKEMLFAAADDAAINYQASVHARLRNILVNVADDPATCSFILPAVVECKGFTLAVSTGGENPGAARAIREYLESHREELSVRLERGRRRPGLAAQPGKVFIVGAGPGDPDLLTVRALGLLRSAEVIIHDYLVPAEILELAPSAAKICYSIRSKTSGHGSALKQESINLAMVKYAREGKSVVRLKSGDPLVFGRGGEEAEYLAVAGIPFEIVPGITAASGCASAARLPLTRRGISSSVTFLTGHGVHKDEPEIDWARLPADGTLVVYMGVASAEIVSRKLIEVSGLPPDTPCLLVENGTLRTQRVFGTILRDLPHLMKKETVRSPAVIFVGRCAAAVIGDDLRGQML